LCQSFCCHLYINYCLYPCFLFYFFQRKICLSLLVISLLSFVQCGDASDYPSEYCNPLAAQISGLCTAFVSSGDCCPSVISIMDMNPPSICVCSILSSNQMKVFGLTRDTLLEIYYSCQGGKTAMDFTNLCEGIVLILVYKIIGILLRFCCIIFLV